MKLIQCLFVLVSLCGALSCREKEIGPTETNPGNIGLSGTWVLFQRRSWNGDQWITQTVPSSPQQLLTFTYPHQVSAIAIDDTILSRSTYFDVSSVGIIGPAIHLKKSESGPSLGSFTYNPPHDTLYMNYLGDKPVGYSFRRL